MGNFLSPLHEACAKLDWTKLQELITQEEQLKFLNEADQDGLTPISHAINFGKGGYMLATVELLISKGADINVVTKDGDSLLHMAARREQFDVVKLLLDKGCKLYNKQRISVMTQRVKNLIKLDQIEANGELEYTPADAARSRKFFAIAMFLDGWCIDKDGYTNSILFQPEVMKSFENALYEGNFDKIMELVKKHDFLFRRVKHKLAPFFEAFSSLESMPREGRIAQVDTMVLKYLQQHEQDQNAHYFALAVQFGLPTTVKYLIDKHQQITSLETVPPLLHVADINKHKDVYSILHAWTNQALEEFLSKNTSEEKEIELLCRFLKSARYDFARLLLERNTVQSFIGTFTRWSPIDYAFQGFALRNQENVDIFKEIMQAGLNVDKNVSDNVEEEQYPLHLAAQHGYVKCVKFVLEGCGSTLYNSCKGLTPADFARKAGHVNLANYLDSYCILLDGKTNSKNAAKSFYDIMASHNQESPTKKKKKKLSSSKSLLSLFQKSQTKEEKRRVAIERMFNTLDDNKSGILDLLELALLLKALDKVLSSLKLNISVSNFLDLIQKYDTDSNGCLDQSEFVSLVSSYVLNYGEERIDEILVKLEQGINEVP